MSNTFREVNDDILKDWLEFREEVLCALSSDEDKRHFIYFDEIAEKILRNVPAKIRSSLRNNLHCWIIILWIIFVIGMRSIIGMGFVMECR